MLYFVRNVAGAIGTTSAIPLAGIDWFVGKVKTMPLVNCQVFDGLAGSNSETADPVMFFSSMNSSPVPAGSYISSLMTTGPTTGAALAAPNVAAVSATKSTAPSLWVVSPNGDARVGGGERLRVDVPGQALGAGRRRGRQLSPARSKPKATRVPGSLGLPKLAARSGPGSRRPG